MCANGTLRLRQCADIGLGVNAALIDAAALSESFAAFPASESAALQDYERKRLPEHEALIRLVQVRSVHVVGVPWLRVLPFPGLPQFSNLNHRALACGTCAWLKSVTVL